MFVVHFYDGLIYKTQTKSRIAGGAQSYPQKVFMGHKNTYNIYA